MRASITNDHKTDVTPYPPSVLDKIYRLYLKRKFLHFGEKSYIHFPCTIRNHKYIYIGDRVFIREHAWLNVSDNPNNKYSLFIGDGTYIGRFAHINAYRKTIIENDVLIADRVYISDVDHEYHNIDLPIMYQGITEEKPVRISSGSWIGINAVILPGVTVGKNSVIAANSVVTSDIPDYCVAAGNPARIVRKLIP